MAKPHTFPTEQTVQQKNPAPMGTVGTFPHPERTHSRRLCLVWGSASIKITVGAPLLVPAEVGKVMTSSWSAVGSCLGTGWGFLIAAALSREQLVVKYGHAKAGGCISCLCGFGVVAFLHPCWGHDSCSAGSVLFRTLNCVQGAGLLAPGVLQGWGCSGQPPQLWCPSLWSVLGLSPMLPFQGTGAGTSR